MAADKEIMKALETLRLDRPGRTYKMAHEVLPFGLIAALRELAATFREEADLWAMSGARGWKSSETEAFLIAQAVDEVAAQLDNAGGGAALSVSDADLETELRESAKRIDALPGTGASGLDQLIKDSVAERRGHVRDEFLPPDSAARSDVERKTAHDWNADRRIDPVVMSWSDFGSSAHRQGIEISPELPITLATFEQIRDGGAVTVGPQRTFPGQASADEVTAYLKGETDDIPGSAPLTPNSITSAPELGDPFALDLISPPYCGDCDHDQHRCPGCGDPVEHGEGACSACKILYAESDAQPDVVPKTWENENMTADGHRIPGTPTGAPLLGQPGDAGTGYSHDYIPAGGRRFTYAELLTPVPAASLPPHLSHSQGNTIGDCATKYRLQRVEALPQVPQWANVGGSAFHAAVEVIEREEIVTPGSCAGDRWNVDLMWKHHFEEQIRLVSASSPVPVSVWRASRKGAEGRQWWEVNGPLMLRRYLDARPSEPTSNLPAQPHVYGATGDPFQLAIELELTVDVPTPYGPIPFKAQIDRVTNAPQPGPGSPESNWITLVIRDYKTSYERPTDTTQLGDYANALRLWGVPESVKILGTYFDARRGEWTTPVDLLDAHPFEAFQYRVTTAYAQRRALTTGPTPARPSSYCGGCSVRYACPIMAAKS
jgi:hypothetical protein